jgi:hypothetical protein
MTRSFLVKSTPDGERDHPELQCSLVRLEYDWPARRGRAYLAPGDCVDMAGCIAVFERIDPKVLLIETFSGSKRDTAYSFIGGQWCSKAAHETGFYREPDGHPGMGRGEAAAIAKRHMDAWRRLEKSA